jgi:hypothetical protein
MRFDDVEYAVNLLLYARTRLSPKKIKEIIDELEKRLKKSGTD